MEEQWQNTQRAFKLPNFHGPAVAEVYFQRKPLPPGAANGLLFCTLIFVINLVGASVMVSSVSLPGLGFYLATAPFLQPSPLPGSGSSSSPHCMHSSRKSVHFHTHRSLLIPNPHALPQLRNPQAPAVSISCPVHFSMIKIRGRPHHPNSYSSRSENLASLFTSLSFALYSWWVTESYWLIKVFSFYILD